MQFDERQFKLFLGEQEISDLLDDLAAKINADYGMNDRILLVGVLKGAFVVMADLLRRLHSDVGSISCAPPPTGNPSKAPAR